MLVQSFQNETKEPVGIDGEAVHLPSQTKKSESFLPPRSHEERTVASCCMWHMLPNMTIVGFRFELQTATSSSWRWWKPRHYLCGWTLDCLLDGQNYRYNELAACLGHRRQLPSLFPRFDWMWRGISIRGTCEEICLGNMELVSRADWFPCDPDLDHHTSQRQSSHRLRRPYPGEFSRFRTASGLLKIVLSKPDCCGCRQWCSCCMWEDWRWP